MSLLTRGTRITGTLVVDRLLGEGAFAEVHRVEHEYLGWQAMKLFKKVASLDETRTMLGEARLLSTMGHPNIVRLFDANTVHTSEGLRGFFTMEYIAGGSLELLVASHRAVVPVDVAVEVVEQIAAGLTVAHDQSPPIVQRDLTLANILIGYDGTGMRVRISDFGLAKRADPFTLMASAQGTYAFMAPEVLRDEGYSCAGDVWSVGTIAYLLLTNHCPYDGGNSLSPMSTARCHPCPPHASGSPCCPRASTTTTPTPTSTASCWRPSRSTPGSVQPPHDRSPTLWHSGARRSGGSAAAARRAPTSPRRCPQPVGPLPGAPGTWPTRRWRSPVTRARSTRPPISWRRPSTSPCACTSGTCQASLSGAAG